MKTVTDRRATTPWKIGIAAVAAVGLAFTGYSPAFAATIPVGATDVQPTEIGGSTGNEPGYNYDQWHIGNAGTDHSGSLSAAEEEAIGNLSFDFDSNAGITLYPASETGSTGGDTLLFKGYANVADLPAPMTATEFEAFLDGVNVQVASGSVHLQIAGNFDLEGDGPANWTSIWPAAPHGSADALDPDLGNWIGSGTYRAMSMPLDQILDEMATNGSGGTFQVYGVGVNTTEESVVSSITFGGDTYDFATAVPVDPADPADPAAPTRPSEIQTAAL